MYRRRIPRMMIMATLKGLGIQKLLKQEINMTLDNMALIVEFHHMASLPFEANRRLAT